MARTAEENKARREQYKLLPRKCDFGDGEKLCKHCFSTVFAKTRDNLKTKSFCNSKCKGDYDHEHGVGIGYMDKEVECEFCGDNYYASYAKGQKWCSECAPKLSECGGHRWKNIAHNYHISKPQWEDMYKQQGGLCAICGKKKAYFTDHDHKTGRIRGLLCRLCNMHLHSIDKDISWADNAVKYLKSHGCKSNDQG